MVLGPDEDDGDSASKAIAIPTFNQAFFAIQTRKNFTASRDDFIKKGPYLTQRNASL